MKNIKCFAFSLALLLGLMASPIVANARIQAREWKSRLVVSFYSICCGINRQAQEKFDKFITGYEKKRGKRLAKTAIRWGKEGEIDYCLRLSELSPRERKIFIYRVRLLLKRSKLVHINENVPCRSER